MERLIPYTIKIPSEIKAALPAAGRRHNMKATELVRAILAGIVSGNLSLIITQEAPLERTSAD